MNERAYERAVKELTRAKKALLAAKTLLEKDLFEDCVSRAYYAVLHAAKAALVLSEVEVGFIAEHEACLDSNLSKPER